MYLIPIFSCYNTFSPHFLISFVFMISEKIWRWDSKFAQIMSLLPLLDLFSCRYAVATLEEGVTEAVVAYRVTHWLACNLRGQV